MAQGSTSPRKNDLDPMISTQIIDTARGVPAARVPVQLDFFITGQGWREVGYSVTNEEGHVPDLGETPAEGVYRIMFDVAAYRPDSFYPSIAVTFEVHDPNRQYHLPLLLGPFGYSTYLELKS